MILNKDANTESTKSEGEAKIEDEQYGKPNQQCQKHEKVIADKPKTKEMEKENQGDKTAEEDKNQKNTSQRSKLETKHFKLYQENLEDKKIEHNLKEEEQTGNQKQVKGDDTERNIETSTQMTKQKEITLRKNDERERNTGKTKPQNITEGSEKEICMGCNKYVEISVQCGSCYRWYHFKCEGTTEKEIKKLYPEETHYICKKDQNSELTIKWKNQYELKQKEVETIKRINEKTMKEKEEIKGQFDQLKEQHQKDKLKQQQKQNEITKISQEKKILEAVVKTLGNCDRIKINHASGKDQQIKDLQIQLQKEKDTEKILVKDNVEMKSKISTQKIILKQKEQEEKARENEFNEIKKEINKIKRENQQQIKKSNIEKEKNIKTIKKLQEEKDTLEK